MGKIIDIDLELPQIIGDFEELSAELSVYRKIIEKLVCMGTWITKNVILNFR